MSELFFLPRATARPFTGISSLSRSNLASLLEIYRGEGSCPLFAGCRLSRAPPELCLVQVPLSLNSNGTV